MFGVPVDEALTQQKKAARIAGWAYLLIIATSILSMVFAGLELSVSGDTAATLREIQEHELRFRLDTAYSLLMFASVVILTAALYVVVRPVNQTLALIALLWRFGEALLGCIAVLCNLVVLLLLKREAQFAPDQLAALVAFVLDVYGAAMSLVFPFLSLGTALFCYLFYKSKLIPRAIAVFGIASFALLLGYALVTILLPNHAQSLQAICFPPSILFEFTIGFWLLLKGINVPQAV